MFETLVNELQIEGGIHALEGMVIGHKIEKLGQEHNLENYGDFSIRNNYTDYYRRLDSDDIHYCNI